MTENVDIVDVGLEIEVQSDSSCDEIVKIIQENENPISSKGM